MSGAPLRFLGLVVGGWICARAAMLVPEWVEAPGESVRAPIERRVIAAERVIASPILLARVENRRPVRRPSTALGTNGGGVAPLLAETRFAEAVLPSGADFRLSSGSVSFTAPAEPAAVVGRLDMPLSRISRWSASAWALVRSGDAPALAAGGVLGGSQFGGRIGYRIDEHLSLVGRAYAPARQWEASEVALGFEWQPVAGLPVRLLAERRQALAGKGRSAFAAMAHGGVSEMKFGPALVNAYAQAGLVGARSRDMFADGAVSMAVPVADQGKLRVGAAVWGAAQPGVERIDAGPQLTLILPVEERRIRLTADWRFRIAGDAAPQSGPALTVSTDF